MHTERPRPDVAGGLVLQPPPVAAYGVDVLAGATLHAAASAEALDPMQVLSSNQPVKAALCRCAGDVREDQCVDVGSDVLDDQAVAVGDLRQPHAAASAGPPA